MGRLILILSFAGTLFLSCDTLEFENAPPTEIRSAQNIPSQTCGDYVFDQKLTLQRLREIDEKRGEIDNGDYFTLGLYDKPILQIRKDTLIIHEAKYKWINLDSTNYNGDKLELKDGMAFDRKNSLSWAYTSLDSGYMYLHHVHTSYFPIDNDSTQVKIWKNYMTVSFSPPEHNRWIMFALKLENGVVESLHIPGPDLDEKLDRLKAICETTVNDSRYSDAYIVNPSIEQIEKIIDDIYEPLIYFKKVKDDD